MTTTHPTVGAYEPTLGLDVRPVSGFIGAEIAGVDLAHDLDGDDGARVVAAIRAALLRHRVIAFRNQSLDVAGQVAFAQRFGTLTRSHPTVPALTSDPRLFDIDSADGIKSDIWHTDVTFIDRPVFGSVLRAVTVPPYGGDTVFANTVAAYAGLPASLQALVDGLDAVHTNNFDYVSAPTKEERDVRKQHARAFTATRYRTVHPVVQVHPETGERALLLGGFASHIRGMSPADSADLLRLLGSHVHRLENTVRWRWAPGDVIFWDNRSTQHYALADYGDQPRKVQRVTLAGTVPVGVDGRRSEVLEGDSTDFHSPTPT